MTEIAKSPAQRGALRVSARVKETARLFRRGIKSAVGVGRDTYVRTAEKIKRKDTKIAAENRKQERMSTQTNERLERSAKETAIESKSGKSFIRPVGNVIKKAVTTPLKALMNLIAAWAIDNLPKIIKGIQIFIKRLKVLKAVIKRTFRSVISLFGLLKNIAGAWIQNMIEFDFEDSKGRLEAATQELEDNMDEIRIGVSEFQNVWSREEEELDRMLERLDSEETLSEIIQVVEAQQTIIGPEATRPASGERGPTRLTDVHRQALDKIAQYESVGAGGYNAMNQGTVSDRKGNAPKSGPSKDIIGKNLTDMTVGEVIAAQSKKLNNDEGFIHAAGRYQFIGNTLPSVVEGAGIDKNVKFSPEVQDQLAIHLMQQRGAEPWLADARTPLLRDQAGIDLIETAGKTPLLASPQTPAPSTAPATQAPQPAAPSGAGTISNAGATTKTSGIRKGDKVGGFTVTSAYGPRWGSTHKGIDIGTPTGTYIAFSVPVEIMAAGWYGGYGYLVDAWAPSLGVQMRVAHLSELKVKRGQNIAAGVPVGRAGSTGRSTGPHVHFEVDRQKNGTTYGGSASVADLAKFIQYLILSSSPPKKRNKELTAAAKSSAPNTTLAAAGKNRTNLPQGSSKTMVVTQKEYITVA